MRRVAGLVLLSCTVLILAACSAHVHVIGSGGQGNAVLEQRQWYVLFGLVPINNVDTKVMAGTADNYTIRTEQSALDVVINIFTGLVSVYSRTVTVTK